jgi:hypothetical protein
MSATNEASPAQAQPSDLERLVMHKNSDELIDKLALMLGIAGDESAEERWGDEVFKRKVLRGAIIALDAAWNPKCCEGGSQWGHAWDCKKLP